MDFVKLTLWDWLPNGHATAFYSIGAMRRKHPEWFRDDLATLFDMLAGGRIAPVVAEVLPLAQVRKRHERVEAGDVAGKLVLRVSEPRPPSTRSPLRSRSALHLRPWPRRTA